MSDQATDACHHAPCCANVRPRKNEAIAATPAATPSRPSSRLKALVSATNQNSVASTLTTYDGVTGITAPQLTSATPASSCSRNLIWGRMPARSSARPTRNIAVALTTTPKAGPSLPSQPRQVQASANSHPASARPAAVGSITGLTGICGPGVASAPSSTDPARDASRP